MSDLRAIDRLTSRFAEELATDISGAVHRWEHSRDANHRGQWEEYYRLWMGQWSASDRERASERCKAIMPAIQQAVDSAVSEVEEAIFGRERWFDLDTDDPATREDEGSIGRMTADRLLQELRDAKAGISKAVLLGAVYGTGIAKLLVFERADRSIGLDVTPIEPLHFAIEPGAETVDESRGVAHVFYLPRNVVLERQRQGIYASIDPGSAPEPEKTADQRRTPLDHDMVRIIEWQGQVPARMLPDSVREGKLAHEDDRPVEAIVTIANDQVVLRATPSPLEGRDRGIVAFQWDTVPGRFWGRGIVEKGYWPQKVLDAEVRGRIDALAFSVVPMMAINAAMVPRNSDFSVRPGRNVFLNGNPAEALTPLQFPPPDPQTYQQGQEMQRMIEMATGQLQAATPFNVNGRNETASGMSMMLGASIRRTRRTMANIERSFLRPLIDKSLARMQLFEPETFPRIAVPMKVHGTLGMMAREFEQMQLTQLLNAIPPGPQSLMILRAIVDNMGLNSRQDMLQLLDLLLQQSLQPEPEPRDLGGEARLLSAQARVQVDRAELALRERGQQIDLERLRVEAARIQREHERALMQLSIEADKADSDDVKKTSDAILSIAKAEAEELGSQLEQYRAVIERLRAAPTQTAEGGGAEVIDLSEIRAELETLRERLADRPGLSSEDVSPINIERDSDGLVTRVNGRGVQRNDRGLIVGLT